MKILLYSRCFWPSVGGIETVSQTLAAYIINSGHECIVMTETPLTVEGEVKFPYQVVRRPMARERFQFYRWADIVHSNGASLKAFLWAFCAGKSIIWTHTGYQLTCIDGLGWYDDSVAPMTPFDSLLFHVNRRGFLLAMWGWVRLMLRRCASRYVELNIAITQWVAMRQPLPRQIVIYNPFPLSWWTTAQQDTHHKYDLIFVGRLVSEKGCETLLRAFYKVARLRSVATRLLIIGDGPERQKLLNLANVLGIADMITFSGTLSGKELLNAVAISRIAVVPSTWEEAMGGVALELMAAGKAMIVSERGGLAECCGPAALTFPNGDNNKLADNILALIDSPERIKKLRQEGSKRLVIFDEHKLCKQYLDVYEIVFNNSY